MKRRRSWKNQSAVSEIIGNLLILVITVTLFSGILYFVSSMPAPTPSTYGDFVGQVRYSGDSENPYCNITIKHLGGQVLEDHNTNIILLAENEHFIKYIHDSDPSIGIKWNLGSTWVYNDTTTAGLCDIDNSSYLKVMIVDIAGNSVVWEGVLLDKDVGSSMPVIMDRYLASWVSGDIWVRDRTFTNNQPVALFVNIRDEGNEIENVYADVSSLGGPQELPLNDKNGDGWWSSTFMIADMGGGSRTIYIETLDKSGRSMTASLTVDLYNDASSDHIGGSGSPPPNLYYSGLQGLNVFKYSEWVGKNYSAVPTTQFNHEDLGVVVVASKFLVNLENANDFYIIDPKTREIYWDVSSPNVIFHPYEYYSGYYIYTALINIPQLEDNGRYLLQIQLRDTWMPNNNVFFATTNITVGSAEFPKFETFSDPNYQTECTNFTSDQTIYVKITTSTSGKPLSDTGLVEICDYNWNMQVKRIPGQEPNDLNPVTAIEYSNPDIGYDGPTTYKFKIRLGLAHQDPWIPGKSSYTLRYDMFHTERESHLLIKTINVTSPKIILDMVTGIDAVKGGWAAGSLINYYKNDNQWVPPDFIAPWAGKHTTDYSSATLVRLGDINNNGRNDVVAVLDSKYIYMYLNNGQWSPRPIEEVGKGKITAMELGYVDSDNSVDVIVGYDDGSVGYYRNDGVWTYYQIEDEKRPSPTSRVTSIAACDSRNIVATQGYLSGMDVLVGYESGGVLIWKSSNNMGISWSSQQYTGGMLSFEHRSAESERNTYSYVSQGDFSSTAWDGTGYEQLWEKKGPGRSNTRPTPDLQYIRQEGDEYKDHGDSVLVPKNGILAVDQWLPVTESPFNQATLIIDYRVEKSYNNFPWIKWAHDGDAFVYLHKLDPAQVSPSGPIEISLPNVNTLEDLKTLHFSLTNYGNKNIFIYDFYIEVEFPGDYYQMEHEWTFNNIPQSTMNTFDICANVGANVSDVIDYDTFTFQYKWAGQNSFSDFSTPLVVDSPEIRKYSGIIGATPSEVSSITIRAVDNNRHPYDNTSLFIQRMCINTTSISNDPIGSVTSIRVADMDGANGPDMLISDKSNVWVCLNDGEGNLLPVDGGRPAPKITSNNFPSDILTIGAGKFHSCNGLMDIVVGTTDGIYMINQTSLGIYVKPILIDATSSYNINYQGDVCMAVGDVDGDGDADIVIASGKNLILFTNDVDEDGMSTIRKAVTIDVAATEIRSIYLGKLQNN